MPADARVIELPSQTLIPGMIEGHGHLFLHPYNEAKWDDQVLHESIALRTARAVIAARATLMARFTSDAFSNLPYLLIGMGASVPVTREKGVEQSVFYREFVGP